jgi:hypothetical protein
MDFWILPTFFVTFAKLIDMDFYLTMCSLMCLKLWDIGWIMFMKKKIDWMNGMWF